MVSARFLLVRVLFAILALAIPTAVVWGANQWFQHRLSKGFESDPTLRALPQGWTTSYVVLTQSAVGKPLVLGSSNGDVSVYSKSSWTSLGEKQFGRGELEDVGNIDGVGGVEVILRSPNAGGGAGTNWQLSFNGGAPRIEKALTHCTRVMPWKLGSTNVLGCYDGNTLTVVSMKNGKLIRGRAPIVNLDIASVALESRNLIGLADLDGDGSTDMVYQERAGEIAIWNSSDPKQTVAFDGLRDPKATGGGEADGMLRGYDLNGDKHEDLLFHVSNFDSKGLTGLFTLSGSDHKVEQISASGPVFMSKLVVADVVPGGSPEIAYVRPGERSASNPRSRGAEMIEVLKLSEANWTVLKRIELGRGVVSSLTAGEFAKPGQIDLAFALMGGGKQPDGSIKLTTGWDVIENTKLLQ